MFCTLPTIINVLKFILNLSNINTFSNSSGNEGIQTFNEEKMDLIIMDLHMPGMNGIETSKEIRRLEIERGLERTPIILLTGTINYLTEPLDLYSEIDEVLLKPFRKNKLYECIYKYIQ